MVILLENLIFHTHNFLLVNRCLLNMVAQLFQWQRYFTILLNYHLSFIIHKITNLRFCPGFENGCFLIISTNTTTTTTTDATWKHNPNGPRSPATTPYSAPLLSTYSSIRTFCKHDWLPFSSSKLHLHAIWFSTSFCWK